MTRNFYVLLVIGLFVGLSLGVYELALPLYLKARAFSPVAGSLVFAVSALCALVMRLLVGHISDRLGRKRPYLGAILLAAVSTLATPFFHVFIIQAILKSLGDAAAEARRTLHAVLLYESAPGRFLDFIGKTQGAEMFFQALGALTVGLGLGGWSQAGTDDTRGLLILLLGSAAALFLCCFVAGNWLVETREASRQKGRIYLSDLPELVRLDPRLLVLTAAMFVFNIGLGATHCYIMPLFFQDKFGVSYSSLGWIMCLHRASIALPLVLAGQFLRGRLLRHEKAVIGGFLFFEGLSLLAAGLLPWFWWATVIWLLHDFFGAGVWSPINSALMQRYSREHARGNDVALSMSASYVGFVVGALLGGFLYTSTAGRLVREAVGLGGSGPIRGLPFAAGGLLMMLAVPFYIWLHFIDRRHE